MWEGAPVVTDGNVITGQGPAFAYAFAYELMILLGLVSVSVKSRMVYYNAAYLDRLRSQSCRYGTANATSPRAATLMMPALSRRLRYFCA